MVDYALARDAKYNHRLTPGTNYYLRKLIRTNLADLKSVVRPGAAIQVDYFNDLNDVIESLYIEPAEISPVVEQLEKLALVHQNLSLTVEIYKRERQECEGKIYWLLGLKCVAKRNVPTVLIVDEDIRSLRRLSHALKKLGYEVHALAQGDRALSTAHALVPDLVLMNADMSETSGFRVCETLKGEKICRDIPVIFLSASDDIQRILRALEAGGIAYITKPFQMSKFLDGMRQLIGQRNDMRLA